MRRFNTWILHEPEAFICKALKGEVVVFSGRAGFNVWPFLWLGQLKSKINPENPVNPVKKIINIVLFRLKSESKK